jgi:hypothetical protein
MVQAMVARHTGALASVCLLKVVRVVRSDAWLYWLRGFIKIGRFCYLPDIGVH